MNNNQQKPKPRKVNVTFDEYEAIISAIGYMENDRTQYVKSTEVAIKDLKKLLNKILKV